MPRHRGTRKRRGGRASIFFAKRKEASRRSADRRSRRPRRCQVPFRDDARRIGRGRRRSARSRDQVNRRAVWSDREGHGRSRRWSEGWSSRRGERNYGGRGRSINGTLARGKEEIPFFAVRSFFFYNYRRSLSRRFASHFRFIMHRGERRRSLSLSPSLPASFLREIAAGKSSPEMPDCCRL